MEFNEIMQRVSEGLIQVDQMDHVEHANQRTGEIYMPGIPSLKEERFVGHLMEWWYEKYPTDFKSIDSRPYDLDVRYPSDPIEPRAKLDLAFSTDGAPMTHPSWAIEFKRIQLCGNNGKRNDYATQKLLSPYLKDRSLKHDIERLRRIPMGQRQAVIGYGFEYDKESLTESKKRFPNDRETTHNLKETCRQVNPTTYEYSVLPLVELADQIYTSMGYVRPLNLKQFEDAWRHPAGGKGWVFGWEIIPQTKI